MPGRLRALGDGLDGGDDVSDLGCFGLQFSKHLGGAHHMHLQAEHRTFQALRRVGAVVDALARGLRQGGGACHVGQAVRE